MQAPDTEPTPAAQAAAHDDWPPDLFADDPPPRGPDDDDPEHELHRAALNNGRP